MRLPVKKMMLIVFGWVSHRKVTMLMLFVALVASLFPLSLLWKIRASTVSQIHGVIERQPGLRELFPEDSYRDTSWFQEVETWPEVSYIMPSVLNGMMTVEVAGQALDLLPSSSGDPVVGRFLTDKPPLDWLVLSQLAASKLGVVKGDKVKFDIFRDDGSELQSLQFNVVGVVGAERDELIRGYVSLKFLEQLESYRVGFEVKARDWPARPGKGVYLEPVFDGLILAAQNRRDLPSTIDLKYLSRTKAAEELGVVELPSSVFAQVQPGVEFNVETVNDVLSTLEESGLSSYVATLPFVSLQSTTEFANKNTYPVVWNKFSDFSSMMSASQAVLKGLESKGLARNAIEFPIKVSIDSNVCANQYLVPHGISASISCMVSEDSNLYQNQLVNLARTKQAYRTGFAYSNTEGWQLNHRQYAGFRIYANSLDQVEPLQAKLRSDGINTVSNQSFAASFLELDSALRKYLLILSLFIVAGAISVISMNFAAIARLQTETYALLRQFGVSSNVVLLIPCLYVVASILPAWLVSEALAAYLVGPVSRAFELVPGADKWSVGAEIGQSGLLGSFYLFLIIVLVSVGIVVLSTSRLLSQPISNLFRS